MKGKTSKGIKFLVFALACVMLLALPQAAFAHQPNLVENARIEIQDPEISRAFYGTLEDTPHNYLINSPTTFNLYLNLLAPRLPNAEKDFTLTISQVVGTEEFVLKEIKTADYPWKEYYEEFAGDNYYMGPEWEARVGPGIYLITISSSNPHAKYVLAVGKTESFPVSEMLRTLGVLPALKMSFFEGSFFDVFNGIIGKFLLGFIILILVILGLVIFLIVRNSKRKRRFSHP
ncbi:MAG: hypothetical protein QMD88_00675 [Coprothermobacterota bacterium]|nr:hypothetical protein [Coprothermobacterota bacterium]